MVDVWRAAGTHPYSNYPFRFRHFFNNFMMSKTGDNTIDSLNWQRDIMMYKLDRLLKASNLQLPNFNMALDVYNKFKFVSEKGNWS
uniref:Uncharacterized protein n=1 Tax=viral metagenome TaxID=1070528 RepID=A0A6H1ZQ41_9ZZZZ